MLLMVVLRWIVKYWCCTSNIYFDCQITDGRVQTYFAGTIIIEQDITK
jgi:hypothetical protein